MIENTVPIYDRPYSSICLNMDEEEFRKYAEASQCEIFSKKVKTLDPYPHQYINYYIQKGTQWFTTYCFKIRDLTPEEVVEIQETNKKFRERES
jgi:hypothetical protein